MIATTAIASEEERESPRNRNTSRNQRPIVPRCACVHDLTTIRRNPVSPISAVPQGKLWIKRKYQFGFVGIKAGC